MPASYAALQAHWEAVRRGPQRLTHKQFVALSGDTDRAMVDRDDEPRREDAGFRTI